jgi:16S rRNA A1518/A1519 N6-dimethyltransferase RsmA/KsgA/DIM1 with predicted DNA glycosylase/AP lyase activity
MLLLLLAVAVLFGVGAVLGAPYLPVLKAEHDNLLDMCELQPGDTLLDLGSGDGRFLRAAAKRGYNAIGYEINPLLYLVSLLITWRHRKQVTIILGDYWHRQLPEAQAIYVFLIDRYMDRLDKKLTNEIHSPTNVISFVFAMPNRKPNMTTRNAFRYRYGSAK